MFVIVRISVGIVIAVSGLYEISSNFSYGCTALLSGGFMVLAGIDGLCRADPVPETTESYMDENPQLDEPFPAKTKTTPGKQVLGEKYY